MRQPAIRPFLLALTLLTPALAAACGGSRERVEPDPQPTTGSEPVAQTPESPWDGENDASLADRVRAGAISRIREAEPTLTIDGFSEWRASPDAAPQLGDRVCEQLLNLAVADLAVGDLDGAERTVRLVRARARNRNQAFVGNTLLSVVARRRAETGGGDAAAQRDAVASIMREQPRARFNASTVVFQMYQERTQVDAALEQTRQQLLGLDTAVGYLFVAHVLADVVAHHQTYLDALTAVRAEHDARPADAEHAFSTVDLTGARDAQPVLVAVWDTGTAESLFSEQLFTNAAEQPNGADDDGNGLIDDIHGIASDPDPAQTALLYDPSAPVIAEYGPFLRGVMDLRAGMASTDAAQRVLALMRSATDAQSLETLEMHLDQVGEWAHGTHVAGLMVAGLPQARLAIFRSAWAGESRVYHHRGPTDEELAAEAANMEAIATFIRAHHVRVVNASLGFSEDYLEAELGYQSELYPSEATVRARAAQVHAQRRALWERIIASCPDTLFVIAAGNSNRDVVEYGDVAGSLSAPNLLVIGAVDRFGNWATFTSSSPTHVRLFDLGVEVDSVIPDGQHVPLSGTSMASPNAANLAAKMISVDLALTPERVIQIMIETGEPIAAPFGGAIAHEANALARVRRERRRPRR